MSFSDEILMAYADGELEPAMRVSVEQAMASDPELARRIASYRALRSRLQAHYAPILREPVPERLLKSVREPVREPVRGAAVPAGGDAARVADGNVVPLRPRTRSLARGGWQLTALAASIVLGVLIGVQLQPLVGRASLVASHGQLLARGALAAALSEQLASDEQGASPVQIGISYLARSGEYCRSFVLHDRQDLAGVACREPQDWRVQLLASSRPEPRAAGAYRQAASAMPDPVRQAIESEIEGEPLDARAEAAARSRHWRGGPR